MRTGERYQPNEKLRKMKARAGALTSIWCDQVTC